MEITINKENGILGIMLNGRLTNTTAPQLESAVNENISGANELVLDFKELEYLSSAGLRVLLSTQKMMNKVGKMTLRNVNDDIMEVFDMTGFSDILTIENN